jgi:hypothetical protein
MAGKDGRAATVELRSGKKKGVTIEHLLATMVSVPPSPRRMPVRGIMEHLLAMMVSLPGSPLSVGQATDIFFI